ncbi:MAG: MerR family transcriptional regulator, partial [Solobacterium sp.]|nr:MerR family transcriptional regulator [Solobacterium sp.]
MKEFYQQKDICRLLNVTRETLRFYEKEGLIHPLVNETNQYRLYDDYQMYLVAECKRYQQNHFSIREIKRMLSSDTLEEYTDRICEKAEFIEGEIRTLEKELDLIREYSEKLKQIKDELSQPSVS